MISADDSATAPSLPKAIFLGDREIGLMALKVDHTIHPVGYLQNATMDSVTGRR
ncbi:MAG: hypothetical protein R2881_09665 [Eubacteriales bacterium]